MEDLTGVNMFPYFHNFTGSSNLSQIKIPSSAGKVTIGSQDQKLYVAQNGATDGQAPPANRSFIPKDNIKEFKMGRGYNRSDSLFVCCQTGSGNISIILEE